MSGGQWDRTIPPTTEELIRAWIEHHLTDVHVARPARVQAYDAATQTADLVPLVRGAVELPDGTIAHEDLPVLPCVPVLWPRTGDHFIAFALQPGDTGLVVFCDAAIGHWRASTDGGVTDPGDLTRHSLSHGVFVPGLFHRAGKLANAPNPDAAGAPRLVVGSDEGSGTRVTLYASGDVKITRGTDVALQIDADGTVHVGGAAGEAIATAAAVTARLDALKAAIAAAATGPDAAGIKSAFASWSATVTGATKAKAA